MDFKPHYNFDSFIVGASNKYAHAAAKAVAEAPSRTYNPLFIYGDTGMGKTHLMQAMGNYMVRHFPAFKVLYVTAETYLDDFIKSIRESKKSEF